MIDIDTTITIRNSMRARGMTQKDLAQRLNISEQYLSDILSGRRDLSAFVAVRLEAVLALSAHGMMFRQLTEELDKARSEYMQSSDYVRPILSVPYPEDMQEHSAR